MGARVDLITALLSMLDAFIAANPTLLRRRFAVRPPSLVTDLPCAYIDLRPEDVHWSNSVRDRVLRPSIVFVDQITDNAEVMQRMDTLVDAFTDFLDGYAHLFVGTGINNVWSNGSWNDESVDISVNVPAEAVRWSFADVLSKQGRS